MELALMEHMIWQAMFGNGSRIGTPRPIPRIYPSPILWDQIQVNSEYCGAWNNATSNVRSATRDMISSNFEDFNIGFRCTMSATP